MSKEHTSSRPFSLQEPFPDLASAFLLGPSCKSYKHQFSNLYFVRLHALKSAVEKNARDKWNGLGVSAPLVPRVLDVTTSQLCIVIGTIYMDMPRKPNVIEDLNSNRSIPVHQPPSKYHSPEDCFMLEDESGRIRLVGDALQRDGTRDSEEMMEMMHGQPENLGDLLVTGVVVAVLGRQTAAGDFDVKDFCFAGMPPMLFNAVGTDGSAGDQQDEWIAFVSGLEVDDSSDATVRLSLLAEYLTGEVGLPEDQNFSSRITRLVIAGNSLAPTSMDHEKPDATSDIGLKSKLSTFSPDPLNRLSDFLGDVAQAMPVHLLAGPTDPSGAILPQQPLPRAMFRAARVFDNFKTETNPAWLAAGAGPSRRSLYVHSGQSLEDMYRYAPSPPVTRLEMASAMLHWRHAAPTAPDTLWCYPYLKGDPFVLQNTPDLLVFGCQPAFETRRLDCTAENSDESASCTIVLVPEFRRTGTIVLVNMRDLEVRSLSFHQEHMGTAGSDLGIS